MLGEKKVRRLAVRFTIVGRLDGDYLEFRRITQRLVIAKASSEPIGPSAMTDGAFVAFTIRLLGRAGAPFAIVLVCFAIQWILVMAAEKAWSRVPRDAQDSSSIVGKDSSASSNTS